MKQNWLEKKIGIFLVYLAVVLAAMFLPAFSYTANATEAERVYIDLSTLSGTITTEDYTYKDSNPILHLLQNKTYSLSGTKVGMGIEVCNTDVVIELNGVNITGAKNSYGMASELPTSGCVPFFSLDSSYPIRLVAMGGTKNTIMGAISIYTYADCSISGSGDLKLDYMWNMMSNTLTIDGVNAHFKQITFYETSIINIKSGGLYIDLDPVPGPIVAFPRQDKETLQVNVSKGAVLSCIPGIGYRSASLDSHTTVINNGGTVYVDGSIYGKAINNEGKFEVTGTVKDSEGTIIKPTLEDVVVDIGNLETDSPYYEVIQEDYEYCTQMVKVKKKANFILTGENKKLYWYDEWSSSTYTLSDVSIGMYSFCNTFKVTVKGKCEAGFINTAGASGNVVYSGDGSLSMIRPDEFIQNAAGDTGFELKGPKILLKNYDYNMLHHLSINYSSGSVEVRSDESEYNYYIMGKTPVKIHFEENGGSDIADVYYWGEDGYTVDAMDIPDKDGYIFTGWYEDSEFTKEAVLDNIKTNKTLYAKWEAHEHDFKEVSAKIEPTCYSEGKEAVFRCSRCDATKGGEAIAKSDMHTWDAGVITKQPTETEEGVKTYTCICGMTLTQVLAKLDPKPSDAPSGQPSTNPSNAPSGGPSGQPSANPSTKPSVSPSTQPAKQTIKIAKRFNKPVTFQASKLKDKKMIIKLGVKAKTKVSYKITKGNKKYISVSKKGVVTLKKGCKKGTYKVAIIAKADKKYKKATKTVTIKVK